MSDRRWNDPQWRDSYTDRDVLPYEWDAVFNCQATAASESAERTVVGLVRTGKRIVAAGQWDDLADDLEVLAVHDWNPAASVAAWEDKKRKAWRQKAKPRRKRKRRSKRCKGARRVSKSVG